MKTSTKAKIGTEAMMFVAVGYLVGLLLRKLDAEVSEATVAAVTGLVMAIIARVALAFGTRPKAEPEPPREEETVDVQPPSDIDDDSEYIDADET